MGFIVEKKHVEVFVFTEVHRNYITFRAFKNHRKDISACSLCDTEFKDEDNMHLAFVETHKNQLICDTCADKVEDGIWKEESQESL